MSSNNPVNNERSSSSRRNMEKSFTENISARMKKFFKITKWFTRPTTSNTNGIERSIEENSPECPPSKRMRFSYPGTSVSYTSSIDTRSVSTNTDSTEIHSPVQAGMVRTPTMSTYSENKEEKSNYSFSLSNNTNSITRKRKSLFDARNDHSDAQGSTFYQGETVYGGASTSYMNRPNIKFTKNTHLHDNKINHDVTISHSTRRICDLLENYSSPLIEAKRILQCTNSKNSADNISDKDNTVTDKSNSFAAKTQELHSPCLANILKFKQKARLMDTTRVARQLIASLSSSEPYILPDNKSSNNREKKSEEVFTTKIKTILTKPDHGILVRETQPPLELPSNALQIDMNNLPTYSQFSPIPSHNVKRREPENNKLFKFSSPEKKANDLKKIKISPPKWSGSTNNNEILEKEKNVPSSAKSIMFTNHGNNKNNASDVPKPIPIVIDLDKWCCPTCMIKNDNSIESCVCCREKKPKKTESSNTAFVSNSITNPIDLDKWRCPTCLLNNDNSIESCGGCDEKKPKKTKSLNTAVVSDSITKPIDLDKWRCPTCMIKNDNSIESCVCCGEKKPNKTESLNTAIVSDSITKPIDLDKWRCPTCMIKNDNSIESCVCCGEKKPKKTESLNTTIVSDSITKPIDLDKWRCPTCMIKNDNSIESCVCCGEKKPKKTESLNTTIVSDSITKPIDLDKWRCPTCMIKNDNSIESCVCCGEKKPKKTESSNTAVVDSITKPNISFSNQNMSIAASTLSITLVDSQKNKWECPGCYVRNEKNVRKCVCCETNKPGLSGITQNKGFNFSQTSKNAFKFGINPKDYTKPEKPTIEVTICNQDNNLSKPNEADTHIKFTSTATTEAAAEPTVVPASVSPEEAVVTSAPVASVAPVVTVAPVTSTASVSSAASEVSVAPVASATPAAAAAPISTAVPEVAAAPITVAAPLPTAASVFPTSSLPTGADVTTGVDNNVNQTSILLESSQKPDISIATGPTNILVSPLSPIQPAMSATFMNNKDSSINGFQIASTSIEAQNKFSFSAPPQDMQPVVKLFSPPTTSSSPFLNIQVSASSLDTPTSNVSQISYASNPVTTSLSFFQSNNLISNPAPSTSSLFKRNETTTIEASNAVVPNPSVFNFGNNTQNLQPQSGSSKFNFFFTTKNPEVPSIFSAQAFGSQPSNNIEGNKTFNLAVPSGNGLSGNTGMMNNILPGNGLSTGNPLESISRGNGVVTMGDETTSNQMISGNNLLGGHSSPSTAPGFHTQMNRDVWPTSNTGANSFSFTRNTRFNSPNSVPAPPRFGNPSGPPATRFGIATQMTVNLPPQNIFGSQPPANAGGIFGAPRMPSTMVPTTPSFERNFGNPATPFNFGVGAQTSGPFGQTQIQPNQPIVYNFGGQLNGMVPQVQFNMGSSPGTPARRVRKAIRRTTQR